MLHISVFDSTRSPILSSILSSIGFANVKIMLGMFTCFINRLSSQFAYSLVFMNMRLYIYNKAYEIQPCGSDVRICYWTWVTMHHCIFHSLLFQIIYDDLKFVGYRHSRWLFGCHYGYLQFLITQLVVLSPLFFCRGCMFASYTKKNVQLWGFALCWYESDNF